ncbi:MAG: hypothetical protein GY943_30180 [Chloroflexi bacterium]|nr:hypothetical protein [Chloroflexota bacterium]
MLTYWENKQGNAIHYVHLTADGIVIGSHMGSGHTDNASSSDYAEFLNGRFHPPGTPHLYATKK